MEKEKIEEIILSTLEDLPDKFKRKIENLSIVVEEERIRPFIKNKERTHTHYTLGLFQGVPATYKRGSMNTLPNKITIFKKSLEKVSRDDKELEKNIRRVVLHELGHYFGLNEEKLKKLGY
jgi:predicted Zn-dependent protease with MMP-like domain